MDEKIQNGTNSNPAHDTNEPAPATVVIAGGGIVGLVLALALKKHCGIVPEIYEKANQFYDDVGAALGCYSNGCACSETLTQNSWLASRTRDGPTTTDAGKSMTKQ